MRKLTLVVIILGTLWGGYWFVGSGTVERQLAGWIEARRAEGWVAEYAALNTRGFPNRFDTTITDLRLADPDTGLAWAMPFFQILSLSYKPNHIVAVWPDRQVFATPFERVVVASDSIQGSLIFDPGPGLALNRTDLVGERLALSGATGWAARLDEARLALHRADGDNTYRFGAEMVALTLPDAMRQAIDPAGSLPDAIDTMRIDAMIAFDRPWDRFSVEQARPQPVEIDLTDLQASWGRLDLRAAGRLAIDPRGVPEGEITIRATNWRDLLQVLVASGALPAILAPAVARALDLLAGLAGNPDTLDAPLTFSGGRVLLGPVPLGASPYIFLR